MDKCDVWKKENAGINQKVLIFRSCASTYLMVIKAIFFFVPVYMLNIGVTESEIFHIYTEFLYLEENKGEIE